MSNYSDKSVCLKGNLKNGSLKYICYPYDEFRRGKWCISIQSVSCDSKESFASSCMLTSNFVTSQKRSTNGEIKTYEEPLNMFLLNPVANKAFVSRFSNT